jgi:hypothetical protein
MTPKKQCGGGQIGGAELKLDLGNITYLFFRLFPIILPTYFILSSIFSMDVKGVIYLAGLMFAVILAILGENSIPASPDTSYYCNTITLSNGHPLSKKIPLSQVVYIYTFCYLVFIIGWYNLWLQNVVTVILLGILVIADIFWNLFVGKCTTVMGIGAAMVIGGGMGSLWAYLIDQSGAVNLQYFNGLSNRTVCMRPSQQYYTCQDTSTV